MAGLRDALDSMVLAFRKLIGAERRRVEAIRTTRALPVLSLHRVTPEPNPFWPPLAPAHLDELVAYLKNHFDIRTFGELREAPVRGDRPPLVLSFDDGYLDFVEHAMPVLARHGVRANMNVIGSSVLSGEPTWNYRLYEFLAYAPESLRRELVVPGLDVPPPGDSPDDKRSYAAQLSRHLKRRPHSEREPLWAPIETMLARWERPPALQRRQMMNAAEVKETARTHEIGSHSFSHESMRHESMAFFRDDFARCRALFAEQLELPLRVYAFPHGSCRDEQIELLHAEGVDDVLLVGEKLSHLGAATHKRLTIEGNGLSQLKFQSLGLAEPRHITGALPAVRPR